MTSLQWQWTTAGIHGFWWCPIIRATFCCFGSPSPRTCGLDNSVCLRFTYFGICSEARRFNESPSFWPPEIADVLFLFADVGDGSNLSLPYAGGDQHPLIICNLVTRGVPAPRTELTSEMKNWLQTARQPLKAAMVLAAWEPTCDLGRTGFVKWRFPEMGGTPNSCPF